MIVEATYSGKGLKIYLTVPEAQRLLTIVARGNALDAFGHKFRLDLLPRVSQFAWGDRDTWHKIKGALDADTQIGGGS
ncbi:MAG: hypothetical protein ABFD92_02155 [Planctomycetaceae bacterium]|nr:hypothetical protein [Planctomycetaceae bacterium]